MKVGDLVTVAPTFQGAYIIVSTDAHDIHSGEQLPECIVLAVPEHGASLAMHKGFIKVLSEA